MLRFILQKMLNKKWMMLALLIGNLLLISITCSNAMYTQASLQRSLSQSLEQYAVENGRHPGLFTIQTINNPKRNSLTTGAAKTIHTLDEQFGLPALETVEHYTLGEMKAASENSISSNAGTFIHVDAMSHLEDHITLVTGELFSSTVNEDGTVDVMVSQQSVNHIGLTLGEVFTVSRLEGPDGEPLRLRVCGIFRNSSSQDLYWAEDLNDLRSHVFMSLELFDKLYIQGNTTIRLNGSFHTILDYTAIRVDQAQGLYDTAQGLYTEYASTTGISLQDDLRPLLKDYFPIEKTVTTTMWVLQIPIYLLLIAFIFMVSKQALDMEQTEIAVLKSRGVSRLQLISTYLLQSLLILALALAGGLPLGSLLVRILGSANAFLEFVDRTPLQAEYTSQVLLFTALAALVGMGVMVFPVLRHSKVTIVGHMQTKHRKSKAPLWQKLCLDLVLIALSLYIRYSYNVQADLLAQHVAEGASVDPMLFLCSSMFLVGTSLLVLRVLPLITFLVYRLFRRWWSPPLYTAFLGVVRNRYSQGFIMFFLVLTVALGIVNAQTARTVNASKENELLYSIGADITLKEDWMVSPASAIAPAVYEEPDYNKFLRDIPGVTSATRVYEFPHVNCRPKAEQVPNLSVMGIETKTFGETAWMADGLLNRHFYEYLNAIATKTDAVLLSRNFETDYGLNLGDKITFSTPVDGQDKRITGTVYGFVDYWPGYDPTGYEVDDKGNFHPTDNYLIVANFAFMKSWCKADGSTAYSVWLRMEGGTSPFYDYMEKNPMDLLAFRDVRNEIVRMKNDPMVLGTNGILTIGFVVVLLICSVGFLIYWILSIRSRSLQFGIYRAMGMRMGEVLAMLLCEQIFLSGTSVACGIGVGLISTRLFMPLTQIAYGTYGNTLPLQVVSQQSDMARLLIIIGCVMLVCMVILGVLISRMKIAQALKLGED